MHVVLHLFVLTPPTSLATTPIAEGAPPLLLGLILRFLPAGGSLIRVRFIIATQLVNLGAIRVSVSSSIIIALSVMVPVAIYMWAVGTASSRTTV